MPSNGPIVMLHSPGSPPQLPRRLTSSLSRSNATKSRCIRDHEPHPLRQHPPSIGSSTSTLAGNDFEDIVLAPPAALASRPTSYSPEPPSPLEDFSSAPRGHQRSLTGTFLENCRPLVSRATSTIQQTATRNSLHSPTKSLASFLPSRNYTSDDETFVQTKSRNSKIFSDWFSLNGSSAPVSIGFAPPSPKKERRDPVLSDAPAYSDDSEDEMDIINHMSTRPSPRLTRNCTSQSSTTTQSTPSKFSWLTKSLASTASPRPVRINSIPLPAEPQDELLTLDVNQALFPTGSVDPLNPSSFNDLLTNAEQTISRLQSAYRAKCSALADARREREAEQDELEESETRARHLKMQLDSLSARAVEQERDMQVLVAQLAQERQRRYEEDEARQRTIRRVYEPTLPLEQQAQDDDTPKPLRVRQKRASEASCSTTTSDSGFESECASNSAESVFSRPSGAMSPTGTTLTGFSEDAEVAVAERVAMTRPPYAVMKRGGSGENGAWAAVRTFREENEALRVRVAELERAVEGALDLVGGLA
ncbi:hypothetical protein H2201_004919 [Coniosporium apollinis]|uniref:Spindle pole body-associated protein cut12 domain-containing protein n=1 Tax=Coniosporium apollinis TaxID=61459 RepID=A0ABQ9NT13_9PEZI|nr:hypothetical protein H2201_004919 [Coniosporium apollinis]